MTETAKLLQACNTGCKYATNNINQLGKYAKDGQLRQIINDYGAKHAQLGDQCHVLLEEVGEREKDPSGIAMFGAKISNSVKMAFSQPDSGTADLLVQGCDMGIRSVSKVENSTPSASEESRRLANDLIKTEQAMAKDLLKFL